MRGKRGEGGAPDLDLGASRLPPYRALWLGTCKRAEDSPHWGHYQFVQKEKTPTHIAYRAYKPHPAHQSKWSTRHAPMSPRISFGRLPVRYQTLPPPYAAPKRREFEDGAIGKNGNRKNKSEFADPESTRPVSTGKNNSYLVKRKTAGGAQFSKDPMNLMNKHTRKVSRHLLRPTHPLALGLSELEKLTKMQM